MAGDGGAVDRDLVEGAVSALWPGTVLQLHPHVTVLVDGEDITWNIRRPEVDREVSPVSAYAGVRRALTLQQRRIGEAGRVVNV